jgi:hypothetical protein
MFSCPTKACSRTCWILSAVAMAYFVLFPDDLEALIAPLRTLLSLSMSVSLGLYGVAAVALVCWAFGSRYRRSETEGH